MEEIILHEARDKLVFPNETLKEIFSDMSEKSKKARQVKTPDDIIKERKGKDGRIWKYIRRIEAMKWLDTNYPGWSFEVVPESFKEYAGHINATVRLTVYEQSGLKRIITCTGSDEIELRKEDKTIPVIMTYYKNAETDALKRCVYTLGGFNDVYVDDLKDLESEVIPDSELEWYIEKALPVLIIKYKNKQINARQIFGNMKNFKAGELSKQRLTDSFKEINN